MLQREQASTYGRFLTRTQGLGNPLRDLLPDGYDRGWHVARNPIKPLNHLDFLRRKEEIAVELNLHNTRTPSRWFRENYGLLAEHQAREISAVDVIKHLARQLGQAGKTLSTSDIASKLRDYATVRHVEFHPSDVCNLACLECTYGHDDPERKPPPVSFDFQAIHKIARMRPRSMVIAGGGEPTLYKSGNHRFQEVVEEICSTNPGIVLALVTNGTHQPPGDWPNRLSWIRVSLDAATEETYSAFRGKPMFDHVLQNYLSYLDYDVRYVGISFLFARSNVQDYAAVTRLIFELVKDERPHALHKVNIQYRPLRRDAHCRDEPFTQAVTEEQIRRAVCQVRELADTSPEMKAFMRNQTNITAILGGNTHPAYRFSRCFYSQTFRIVRANGDLRPCCVRVSEPGFVLGNIRTDGLETIALNALYVGALHKPHCDPYGCRQCHVNYTFGQGLRGDLRPSTSPEVRADPMY